MSELSEFSPDELEAIKNNPEIQNLVMEGMSEEADPYGYPEAANRDTILKLFRDVIDLTNEDGKLAKVGNLKDGEIGYLSLPVRNYLSIAQFAESEGWNRVGLYLKAKSNITLSTSLSRKALLLNLAVTQKRVSQSVKPVTRELKRGLFGTREVISGGDES